MAHVAVLGILVFSFLPALHAVRVPVDRRVSRDDPLPPDRKVEQQRQGIDYPSPWDWSQFFARTNGNFQYDDSKKMGDQWWVEMDQPLYVTPGTLEHTVFFQSQAMFQKGKTTFNNGLSYRYLFERDRYILGINGFYDYRYQQQLQRWSIGGDFHTQWLLLWGNYYGGISSTATTWEKVLSGGDAYVSLLFPYLPWLRLQAGFYIWNYLEGSPSAKGYNISLKANIWKPVYIEGGRTSDRYVQNNYVLVSVSLGFPNYIEFTMFNDTISKTIIPARTLKRFILDLINRNNAMRTQLTT